MGPGITPFQRSMVQEMNPFLDPEIFKAVQFIAKLIDKDSLFCVQK